MCLSGMSATQWIEHTLRHYEIRPAGRYFAIHCAGCVMCSSAIAEELIAWGENVIFAGQISGLPWVEERISSLGFTYI